MPVFDTHDPQPPTSIQIRGGGQGGACVIVLYLDDFLDFDSYLDVYRRITGRRDRREISTGYRVRLLCRLLTDGGTRKGQKNKKEKHTAQQYTRMHAPRREATKCQNLEGGDRAISPDRRARTSVNSRDPSSVSFAHDEQQVCDAPTDRKYCTLYHVPAAYRQ